MTQPRYVTDLSHHQAHADLDALDADGCAGLILKATEGTGYTDPTFAARLAHADRIGLPATGYHFARPATAATAQADHAAAVIGRRAIALDLEDAGSLSPERLTRWALTFLRRAHKITGHRPFVYTGLSFAREHLADNPQGLGEYPLWLARYTASTSTPTPPPWDRWTLWQHTDNAPTAGVGPCDRSRVRAGTDLHALFGLDPAAPPPGDRTYTLTVPGLVILREGARGQAVRNLQGLLRARGYLVECDGIYGAQTAALVRHAQTLAGLDPATGAAGPRTLAWLLGHS